MNLNCNVFIVITNISLLKFLSFTKQAFLKNLLKSLNIQYWRHWCLFCLIVLLSSFTIALFIVFYNSVVVRLSYIFSDLVGRLYEYIYYSSPHDSLTWVLFSLFLYPSTHREFKLFFSCYSFSAWHCVLVWLQGS